MTVLFPAPTPPGLVPQLLILACAGLVSPGQESPPPEAAPPIRLGGGSQAAPAAGPRDLTGEGHAFVELSTPRERYFVEEHVPLTIRLAVEESFAEQSLVQLFQRPLDLPLQLEGDPLAELAHAIVVDDPAIVVDEGPTLALGQEVVRARRLVTLEREGRRYRAVELERTLCPTQTGTLRIPAVFARFAYTSHFQDDVFHGRVATDRIDARVHSRELELTIVPWPEQGRPPGFEGAVGRFTLTSSAEPRDLVLGESLKLVLTIEGSGNLERFPAPRLDEVRDFDVLGSLDQLQDGRRTVIHDLRPRSSDVREVPAVSLVALDPEPPATYRTLTSPPIPILVRPPAGARESAEDAGTPVSHPGRSGRSARWVTPILAALAALGLALGAWILHRRSR